MLFTETGFALEKPEGVMLQKYADLSEAGDLKKYLGNILRSTVKADLPGKVMQKITMRSGQALFRQGDTDTGF